MNKEEEEDTTKKSGREDIPSDNDVSSVADTPSNGNPSGDEYLSTTSDGSSPEPEPSTSSPAPATNTSALPSPPPQETPSISTSSGKRWTFTDGMKRLLFTAIAVNMTMMGKATPCQESGTANAREQDHIKPSSESVFKGC